MKRVISLVALVFGLLLLGSASARADVSISFSFFHRELAPYGRWVAVAPYGDVWLPAGVASGWQPYTNGRWIYTDYGWTWISSDPWGSYPYHYGTWALLRPWGWVWVPGFVWAPAWVTWCYTDDYVGWAPIPPSLHITLSGYSGPPVVARQNAYVFVPAGHLVGVNVVTVRVSPARNAVLVEHSRKVTGFSVASGVVTNTGPSVQRIERTTGVRIEKTSVRHAHVRPARAEKWTGARKGKLSVVAHREVGRSEAATSRAGNLPAASHQKSDAGRVSGHPTGAVSKPPSAARAHEGGHEHETRSRPAAAPSPKPRVGKAPEAREQSKTADRQSAPPSHSAQGKAAPEGKRKSPPSRSPVKPPEHATQHGHEKPPSSADRGPS